MKSRLQIVLACCFAVFSQSCKEEIEVNSSQFGIEYMPLAVGNEWVYNQMEIAYEISGFDTSRFQVREVVVSNDSLSVSGVNNYVVEQSFRMDETANWQISARYSVRVSRDWVLTQIGSDVVTTLDLPVVLEKTWDYYSHSASPTLTIRYSNNNDDFSQSFNSDFNEIGEELFVIISDVEQNIVNQNQQYERYIAGVGLVEKKSIILEFCTVNCESSGQINTGTFLSKKLISYHVANN